MPGLIRLKQLGISSSSEPNNDINQSLIYRNPSARVTWDGIETYKRCVFLNWTPGDEYTEVLTFKNLSGKNVTFTYEVPKTRYFQTLYPRRLTLSQGVTFSLPIQFSPLEKISYADELVVYINQVPHKITLAGLAPQYRLTLEPKELNFGYCAVQDTQLLTFKLTNSGDLETAIEWNITEPFSIEPRECILPVGGLQTFTCSFQPQWALIYVGTATCIYGNQSVCELRVHGTGKFPHVIVSSSDGSVDENTGNIVLNFGQMPLNGSIKRDIIISNQSAFRVPFRIESVPGVAKFDTAFRFSKNDGILEARKRQTISIRFQPKTCEQNYKEYFNVKTQQGNLVTAVIECNGRSLGNSIEINHKKIHFGQVLLNSKTNRVIELSNNQRSSSARFQIYTSSDSPFHFSIEKGSLSSDGSKTSIIVTFIPTQAIGYYKIVPILIENQSPFLIELVGTCHSDLGKPPVLNDHYVENFKRLISRHIALYPFEMLSDYLKRGKFTIDEHGSLIESSDSYLINDNKFVKDEHEYLLPPLANPLKDNYSYWFSNEDNTKFEYVALSDTCFIFDQCSLDTMNEWQQSLTVTNLTRGKLILVWMTTDASNFSISPNEVEIPPLKSTALRVIFRPRVNDTFYTKHFEGYVYYKNQRDFTLIPDYGVTLPVQLDLTCIGNTLRVNHEIVPVYEFDRDVLIFPPINDQPSIFQTLTLTNNGTTPLIYRFLSSNDETINNFTFKPSNGFIKPNEYAIIVVRYKPIRSNVNGDIIQGHVTVRLNEREKYDKILHLFATQEKPRLLVPNDGHIYALTTCVGLTSETHVQIRSLTRSPLEFNWLLDDNIKSIRVLPENGLFNPYEEKDFVITYKPDEGGKVSMCAKLTCWVGDRAKQGAETYHITIHASTRDGYLRPSEQNHDVGPVALGTSSTYDLYLTNCGDCLLRFRLYAKQNRLDNKTSTGSTCLNDKETSIVEFTSNPNGYGEIDGKAKTCVPCHIHPFSRSNYEIGIFYDLLDDNNQPLSDHTHHLCTLTVQGVYPHLEFIDILGAQQAASLSKNLLAKAFNLSKINTLLSKEPTSDELTYAINSHRSDIGNQQKILPKRYRENHDHSLLPPLEQPEAISFNFNAAPINSAPSEIHLLLENRSELDTPWSFLFPKDLQCELEYWARTGDFTEDELNEMKLQDNKIFSINPKRGILKKGSNITITVSYKHIFAGQHILPAIFKVGRSRQIMLNLVGTSVEPGERYVQFYSTVHHLLPVELGAQGAPVQQYELYNGGTVPIHFQVDMSILEQISASNYGFWVLDCLTPEGILAPNKSFVTQWVFNPLEAREYIFNIKIHMENTEPALITFIGHGFDRRDVPDDISKSIINEQRITKQLNLNDRLASLTIDRIHFGNLPLFIKQRRITFLKNQSNQDTISFIWHVTNPEQVRHIRIQPVRGKIQPRQSLPIKVTFMAVEAPAFHDIDLVCEIYNETTLTQYNLQLKKWENTIKEKWERFEIDDKEYEVCLRSGKFDDNDKMYQQQNASSSIVSSQSQFRQGSTLQMCKTLPPVLVNYDFDESNVDRTRRLRENAKKLMNTRPQMPIPELLHLAFTARTLVYNEYLDLCTDTNEIRKFFIDTCLGGDYRNRNSKKLPKVIQSIDYDAEHDPGLVQPEITANIEEADIVRSTLSDLLRSLLSDRVFTNALPEMIHEPIPYFSQLQYKHSSRNANEHQQQSSRLSKDEHIRFDHDDIINVAERDRTLASSNADQDNHLTNRKGHTKKLMQTKASLSKFQNPTLSSTSSTLSDYEHIQNSIENQRFKSNPNVTSLIEDILENTIWNVIQEAYHDEFSLTSRPRLIALPPKRPSSLLTQSNLQHSETNQLVNPTPLITTESFD